jgi:hypothetical protein
MSLIVPSEGAVVALRKILNQTLYLCLYGNDITPAVADTYGTYDIIAGGGYAAKSLTYANWSFTEDDPSYATYTAQNFTFTGALTAPGTVYGYIIIDASNKVMWAERFPAALIPFSPIAGSKIRVIPRIEA